MQFTHTHTDEHRHTNKAVGGGRSTLAALLAVTVAMPKAKANCIFEAYINIFQLCSEN